MADILEDFPIAVPPAKVFAAITTPAGLDQWWTKTSAGRPVLGAEYELRFGPKFDWRARVSACVVDEYFELEMTRADEGWIGTRIGIRLAPKTGGTEVRFAHTGWPSVTENFRVSTYCWAMYLRILKRYLEHGERVPYERRLSV